MMTSPMVDLLFFSETGREFAQLRSTQQPGWNLS